METHHTKSPPHHWWTRNQKSRALGMVSDPPLSPWGLLQVAISVLLCGDTTHTHTQQWQSQRPDLFPGFVSNLQPAPLPWASRVWLPIITCSLPATSFPSLLGLGSRNNWVLAEASPTYLITSAAWGPRVPPLQLQAAFIQCIGMSGHSWREGL